MQTSPSRGISVNERATRVKWCVGDWDLFLIVLTVFFFPPDLADIVPQGDIVLADRKVFLQLRSPGVILE